MNGNTCFTCRWWSTKNSKNPQKKGICFLNPPQAVAIPIQNPIARTASVQPIGIRPSTDFDEYCHGYRSDLKVKK